MENKNNSRVLIVEDERIVAMDIAASLRSLKYDVVGMAASADEAYDLAITHKPDIILMDIRLKGETDGIKATEKIHSFMDVPVIYLTAYADESTLSRAKLTGPYGYLLKPYEKRVLHSTIEMALYKKMVERQIEEHERWLTTILTSIGDALIATDVEVKIKFMNPVAEHLTGFKQGDVLGKHLDDVMFIINEATNERFKNAITLYNNNPNYTEVLLENRTGFRIPIVYSSSPIKAENGGYTGIVIVFSDISEQKRTEYEKERLFNQVRQAQERLKLLSRRLIEVQETEKRNLARELHDEIGQILTAIKINLQTVIRLSNVAEFNLYIKESVDFVDSVLQQVRNLSLDLRPSMLDDLGLVPALRWYIDKQSTRAGITAKVQTSTFSKRLEPQIEITCFRIAQEALTNIIKHSAASNVDIYLWIDGMDLNLKIVDNGKGFNVYSALKRALSGKSIGILGMQERVELIGGKLKIDSKENEGTSIHAIFPLEDKETIEKNNLIQN